MILGFGQCEPAAALQIIEECREAIEAKRDNAKAALLLVEAKYDALYEQYGAMGREEAPERYSRFWFEYHNIHDDKYIVEFHFHHINRRHAFSPDGWALLQTHWILRQSETYGHAVFKEA